MEIDTPLKPTDELYQKIVKLVEYLAECIINNDLKVIILSWMRFRIERSSTPTVRLREIFQIILHNEMSLDISNDHLILFKDAPDHTHIPLGVLSQNTQACLKQILTNSLLFYDSVDITAIQYAKYSKFKYISTFRNTNLWNNFISLYIELLLSPGIDKKYLNGRAMEMLVGFITVEISYAYTDYIKKATGNGSDWREKNIKYVLNLELLYNELTGKLMS